MRWQAWLALAAIVVGGWYWFDWTERREAQERVAVAGARAVAELPAGTAAAWQTFVDERLKLQVTRLAGLLRVTPDGLGHSSIAILNATPAMPFRVECDALLYDISITFGHDSEAPTAWITGVLVRTQPELPVRRDSVAAQAMFRALCEYTGHAVKRMISQ
jgi:hypothetical protein